MSRVQDSGIEPGGTRPVMTPDERTELERLRQENAELRARPPRPPPRRIRWRSVVAVVLLVLGCALVPVTLVATWTRNEMSDTDQFVETVGPLVDDPAVQEALTNRVTATVFEYVDVQALADEAIAALAAQGLPPPLVQRLQALTPTLASATTGFVRDKVGEVVASPQFAAAWDQAVRVAHQQAVTVLAGDSQAVVVQGDTVYLDLAPFIDAAKQRLRAEGLTAVDLVPEVHPTIALAPADQLVRAQSAYSALGSLATVLPWITLLLLAVGVYLARLRMRAVVGAALGVAVALVVLAVGLLVARAVLVGAVPPGGAPAAGAGFDIVVRFLRDSGRARTGRGAGGVPGRLLGDRRRHPPVVHRAAAADPGRPVGHGAGRYVGARPHARAADRGRRPGGARVRLHAAAHRHHDRRHRGRAPGRARGDRVHGAGGPSTTRGRAPGRLIPGGERRQQVSAHHRVPRGLRGVRGHDDPSERDE
jgi:hypothetical protein